LKFLKDLKSVLNITVLVAGLGYFVDLFDITLFGVVRVASLKDLGITDPAEILSSGVLIYNCQMIGMMVGGVIWGTLADKRGRLSVMMLSILLYSLANIANAFAWDVNSYALFRFLGGVGLAGELGAAITLVAESLPKEKRGLGTTIVAMLGMLGIVAAAKFGQLLYWKTAYFTGGAMGLALLVLRFKIRESALFHKPEHGANRGNIFLLFSKGRLGKYLSCIMIGVPVYFTTGVLFTFAPELTAGLGLNDTVTAGDAILYGSIGLALGDLFSGLFSQSLKSRKKAVALMLAAGLVLMLVYLNLKISATVVYVFCFLIGLCVGYWAVLVTMAAEQFGTNIRATVATTVPNFVRGSAIFAVSAFAYLKNSTGVLNAAMIVGSICFVGALLCVLGMDETFSRDLDYSEEA
jgi:MFS transporter, putative metabolite:H+ symporter